MKSFSVRNKFSTLCLQKATINDITKNQLWNLFDSIISKRDKLTHNFSNTSRIILVACWKFFFKERDNDLVKIYHAMEGKFNSLEWFEVYDLLEFILKYLPGDSEKNSFKQSCNFILIEENSAYKFVGNLIIPIISDIETDSIETALSCPYKISSAHIEKASSLLKIKDYHNSIKESISAIEAITANLTNEKPGKFSDSIKRLGKEINLHSSLIESIVKIYGYTSNEDGIRHCLKKKENINNIDQEDSIALLTICSSFVNLIIEKHKKIKNRNLEII